MKIQNYNHRRARLSFALLTVALAVLLGGCAQVEEKARHAVSEVAAAAADEVKEQVCVVTEDGLVSVQDKALLTDLIARARTAGVPPEVLAPADELDEYGDAVTEYGLSELRKECAPEPEPFGS